MLLEERIASGNYMLQSDFALERAKHFKEIQFYNIRKYF